MPLYSSSSARVSSGILGGSRVYHGTFVEDVVPGIWGSLWTSFVETAAVSAIFRGNDAIAVCGINGFGKRQALRCTMQQC